MRPLLLVAVSAALLAPVAVGPASAKACNLLSDPANDAHVGVTTATPSVNALDIRSLDVATGRNTMVVVLRLTSTDGKAEQIAPAGLYWQVDFTVAGQPVSFRRTMANAAGGGTYTNSATSGGATLNGLKVATTPTSITWTLPRSSVPKLKGKGAVLTGFFANGSSSAGVAHDYAPDDSRASTVKYTDKTPSCVRAS